MSSNKPHPILKRSDLRTLTEQEEKDLAADEVDKLEEKLENERIQKDQEEE